ncbi:hypothetical protein D3C84_1037230 [compost metagenome]
MARIDKMFQPQIEERIFNLFQCDHVVVITLAELLIDVKDDGAGGIHALVVASQHAER